MPALRRLKQWSIFLNRHKRGSYKINLRPGFSSVVRSSSGSSRKCRNWRIGGGRSGRPARKIGKIRQQAIAKPIWTVLRVDSWLGLNRGPHKSVNSVALKRSIVSGRAIVSILCILSGHQIRVHSSTLEGSSE